MRCPVFVTCSRSFFSPFSSRLAKNVKRAGVSGAVHRDGDERPPWRGLADPEIDSRATNQDLRVRNVAVLGLEPFTYTLIPDPERSE